jgi:hypothetical protein
MNGPPRTQLTFWGDGLFHIMGLASAQNISRRTAKLSLLRPFLSFPAKIHETVSVADFYPMGVKFTLEKESV